MIEAGIKTTKARASNDRAFGDESYLPDEDVKFKEILWKSGRLA